MKKTDIKQLYNTYSDLNGKSVTIGGWIRSSRDLKDFGFLDVNDGTCFKGVQVVFEKANCENFDDLAKLNAGSSVICSGTVVVTPENKQPFEIKADSVEILSATDQEYPLQDMSFLTHH